MVTLTLNCYYSILCKMKNGVCLKSLKRKWKLGHYFDPRERNEGNSFGFLKLSTFKESSMNEIPSELEYFPTRRNLPLIISEFDVIH